MTIWDRHPTCEHEGCHRDASLYGIEGYDPMPHFWFCDEHAAEFGFCLYCGAFIGGTEDVFLVGRNGMCFDCYRQQEEALHRSYSEGDDAEDYS